MNYQIRKIEEKDNKEIEKIIRSCLIEFNANHEGTAWTDPDLGNFSNIYNSPGAAYWVALDENQKIVGGVGIGPLNTSKNICELQKMYTLPEARGTGIATKLMETALNYATKYYDKCYLETLENMKRARAFYEKHGFIRTDEFIANTDHYACDVKYIKDLK